MEKNILLTIEYDGTAFSGWQRQPSVRTVQGELERVLTDLCGMQDGKPIELNILLTIEYDGTAFSGWQRQPSVRTVQGELERVLTDLCGMQDGKPIELSGTSRTDAGVHALGQRASFKGEFGIPAELERVLTDLCGMQDGKPIELSGTSRTDAGVHALGQRASFKGEFGIPAERIPLAASHMLASGRGGKCACGDVRITAAEEMAPDFHARFNSVGKTYRYIIKHGTEPRVFERNYCYHIKQHLSAENMRKAAAEIVGTHDFACFQAAGGTPRETTVRTVFGLHIIEVSENELHIEITGDGFL